MSHKFIYANLVIGSLISISSGVISTSHPVSKSVPEKNVKITTSKFPSAVLNINGEAISWDAYLSALEEYPGAGQILQSEGRKSAGFSVLQNLVYDTALVHIAKSKGIQVTPAEVQKKFEELKKNQPQLGDILKSSSISDSRMKHELMVELYQYKYITHGIVISENDVSDSYKKDLKDKYTTSQKYKIRVIALPDETKKEDVNKKIKEGGKFEDIAKEFSVDPSKGEILDPIPKDKISPQLQTEIGKLKNGEISDWIKIRTSIIKIKLVEILPESIQPLDTKLKNEIREKLLIEKGNEKNKLTESILNYLTEKKIECLYGKYIPGFNEFLNGIKQTVKQEKENKAKAEKEIKERKAKAEKEAKDKKIASPQLESTNQKISEKIEETKKEESVKKEIDEKIENHQKEEPVKIEDQQKKEAVRTEDQQKEGTKTPASTTETTPTTPPITK